MIMPGEFRQFCLDPRFLARQTCAEYNSAVPRPTLSPSKFTCYLACPQKYHWTYVSARGKWYLRARSYYSFGSSLHRVLELFHQSGDQGVPTTAEALASLEENWIDAGYTSAEEMQEAYGEGKAIITEYVEAHLAAPSKGTTLAVEKRLKRTMNTWDLLGRADRLDEHEDGTIEILDYKSGRQAVTSEDVSNDLAMSAYALMVQDLYPDRSIMASIIALRSGDKASHIFSKDEQSEFAFSLQELGDRILNHEWAEVEIQRKALCNDCDFLKLCQKDPRYGG